MLELSFNVYSGQYMLSYEVFRKLLRNFRTEFSENVFEKFLRMMIGIGLMISSVSKTFYIAVEQRAEQLRVTSFRYLHYCTLFP